MGDITLKKALEEYRTIYMPYRNFAERTREEYVSDLEGFVRFMEIAGMHSVGEIGLPIIQRYVAHLEERGFRSLTRKRKVVVIRSFLLFLYQDEYIDTNLSAKIVVPFTEAHTPHILTRIECERLRQACAKNVRDGAIMEVLLRTGIRLSELIRLTINDIDWSDRKNSSALGGYVRVVGSRGRKERVVPLDFAACVKLREYLAMRNGAKRTTLFLNRFGQPLGERGVQKVIRKHLRAAGIEAASIHTLRHTFGARLVGKGFDRKIVREYLGDKDARSVDIYFALAHPLGKLHA